MPVEALLEDLANHQAFLDNNQWDIQANHLWAILLSHQWAIPLNHQWAILHNLQWAILHQDIRHSKAIPHLVFQHKHLGLVCPLELVASL